MAKTLPYLFFLLLISGFAVAAEPGPAALKQTLAKVFPGIAPKSVQPSPIPGLYEVVIGADVFYATADGKYLVTGSLIDVETRENLTEGRRGQLRLALIDAVGEENMIIFKPRRPKRTITVFTDIDCPYCAKFHLDVPKLVKSGVKVRYLLFPRNGLDSSTYKRSVAVWCAADRKKAIGAAKAGGKLKLRTCQNPVAKHYRLGQHLGVQGTPTIVLPDGRMVPGYVPPPELLALLGLGKRAAGREEKP